MSWFEEWFDSPLYEKIYANRNREEASQLADLIETIIPKNSYPTLLDLGCGRGRHSIALAKRGYQVTGIDLSEAAIQKAKHLSEVEGLTNTRFLVSDMRDRMDQSFDSILNLFTTFGYFLNDFENQKVLMNVSSMLNNEGVFIQDFLNPSVIKKSLVPEEEGNYENLNYRIERMIENDMVYKNIRFTGPTLDKPVEFNERVKLYSLDWFQENLRQAGLALQSIYGEYDGSSYIKENSSRMIMISRKI